MIRAVILLILFSMVLHCSVRLGFATWLYQNRQAIGYTFGLVAEPPITQCGHAYDLDRAVTIEVEKEHHDKAPVHTFYAYEINLFLSKETFSHGPEYDLLRENLLSQMVTRSYTPPSFEIFHPPA